MGKGLAGIGVILGLAIASSGVAANAATLYAEDFSGQNGKGATGGTATDTSGVGWSIELNDASLFDSNDYFRVQNEAFTARDTNSGCATTTCPSSSGNPDPIFPMWLSEVIDISNYTNLSFSLDAFASATQFEHDANDPIGQKDYYLVSYLLDGVEILAADLITATGPFTNQTVNQSVADGSTLQVKVTMNSTAANELLSFDNVLVEGDLKAPTDPQGTPEPATAIALLGLGSLAAISRRRHG